jgi:hypothetical protein
MDSQEEGFTDTQATSELELEEEDEVGADDAGGTESRSSSR